VFANEVNVVVLTERMGVAEEDTTLFGIDKLTVVALVLVICKLPLYVPAVADEGILTYKLGTDIEPDVPTVIGDALVPTLLEKSETVDTSKPVGGVTVIPPTIFPPETAILCAADAVPTFVVNADKLPVVEITGYVIII